MRKNSLESRAPLKPGRCCVVKGFAGSIRLFMDATPQVSMSTSDPAEASQPAATGNKTDRKLRTRRLRVEDLNLGRVTAKARHADASIDAVVEDLSPHGAALIISPAQLGGSLILAGDRI